MLSSGPVSDVSDGLGRIRWPRFRTRGPGQSPRTFRSGRPDSPRNNLSPISALPSPLPTLPCPDA